MGNVLAKAAGVDLSIQLLMFVISYYLKSEMFYDITGSSTFIILLLYTLKHGGRFFPRQVIQSGLVGTWAARLGLFLLFRTMRDGGDSRFKKVVGNPKLFLMYWTVQGLWVWLTLLPTMLLNVKHEDRELGIRDYAGWSIWLFGMLVEIVSDYQKYIFRSNPANQNRWINTGLWSIIRHPNYLGEILLWSGLFVSASSTFDTKEYLSIISPAFVAYLLTKISGIPILEQRNMRLWKDNPQFMAHLKNTYRLLPGIY